MCLFLFPLFTSAETNQERLQPKIEYYANEYHVPASLMNHIVAQESGYDKNNVGDTHLICKKTGKPMKATGLAQINNCYWNIPEEKTKDEDFAISFLGYWISKGHCSYWTTCPRISSYLAMR